MAKHSGQGVNQQVVVNNTIQAPQAPAATEPPPSAPAAQLTPVEALKQLGELRDAGVLTEAEFAEQKALILGRPSMPAAPGPALQPGEVSPGWLPDPAGRHEARYWDGAAWTASVSDAGVSALDPL